MSNSVPSVIKVSRNAKGRLVYHKRCAWCQREFTTVNKTTLTCSRPCYTRYRWKGVIGDGGGTGCAHCGRSLGGARHIQLRRSDGSVAACSIVDADMYDELRRDYWHKSINGYAVRCYFDDGVRKYDYIHRRVLGVCGGGGLVPDHINRDRLDNRRANLRLVTPSQNEQNRTDTRSKSGFRNVAYAKGHGFFARVTVDGKHHSLGGYHESPEQAAVYAWVLRRLFHSHAPKEGQR